jgi:hypothetical protein
LTTIIFIVPIQNTKNNNPWVLSLTYRMYGQHRDLGALNHSLGHTSEEGGAQTASSMGPHDDQGNIMIFDVT